MNLIPYLKAGTQSLRFAWKLGEQLPVVNRCWNFVRAELAEVGLLYNAEEDGSGYLDQIELTVTFLSSCGEAGYVYEDIGWWERLAGYYPGVIYLPSDLPREAYVPGGSLTDTIRHEYAHAWHWLEPEFFETGWFERVFGGEYENGARTPLELWNDKCARSRALNVALDECRNEREREACVRRAFKNEFVSEYAATHFCEDFAETFMYFLRYRRALDRFKGRAGLYRKLKAVEKAVGRARAEPGT